jgi:hypothetical protein
MSCVCLHTCGFPVVVVDFVEVGIEDVRVADFLAVLCSLPDKYFIICKVYAVMSCGVHKSAVHGAFAVWCGVWCGVVWCVVWVWCGVVWCCVVWCDVVWCGVVWCGVECRGVLCVAVWCGVV